MKPQETLRPPSSLSLCRSPLTPLPASRFSPPLTSDKTIKLWKVFDKQIKVVAENNHSDGNLPAAGAGGAQPPLRLPRMTTHDSITAAVPRKVYANAHAYHINSISVNSDGETYISADDLRINLWNLNISDQSFSESAKGGQTGCGVLIPDIVDIKPVNMEELTEVITAAEFHPIHCNMFMYSSSKGTIKLADMREAALCDSHAKRKSGSCFRTLHRQIVVNLVDRAARACELAISSLK